MADPKELAEKARIQGEDFKSGGATQDGSLLLSERDCVQHGEWLLEVAQCLEELAELRAGLGVLLIEWGVEERDIRFNSHIRDGIRRCLGDLERLVAKLHLSATPTEPEQKGGDGV